MVLMGMISIHAYLYLVYLERKFAIGVFEMRPINQTQIWPQKTRLLAEKVAVNHFSDVPLP